MKPRRLSNRRPEPRDRDSGTVFIDVLTSMAFILLLLGMTQTWARAVLYTQRTLEAVGNAHQDATLALEAIARDVRDAGFDNGLDVAPLLAAGMDFIELAADLNGDGDTKDAHEHVRYAYRPDRNQVTRASGRGAPQPFADGVPPEALRFAFFDASGTEVASEPRLAEADLTRVRRIDVRLVIEVDNPDPRGTAPVRAEAETSIALRNR